MFSDFERQEAIGVYLKFFATLVLGVGSKWGIFNHKEDASTANID